MITTSDSVHKLFSTYFHKLPKIAYGNNLYENDLTLFYPNYRNSLYISIYAISCK
jgi:hypothetical protein